TCTTEVPPSPTMKRLPVSQLYVTADASCASRLLGGALVRVGSGKSKRPTRTYRDKSTDTGACADVRWVNDGPVSAMSRERMKTMRDDRRDCTRTPRHESRSNARRHISGR